jgi:putative transcriptional regulator
MPNLKDPNFSETVVLMLEHNAEGAVGLVINRPFPGSPQVVCAGLGIEWNEDTRGEIRIGGPVRTQAGCIVHPPAWEFPDTQIITAHIAVSTSREALTELIKSNDCPFRLLLGYAGWGPGQLEREMTEGTWLLAPVSEQIIFKTAPTWWRARPRSTEPRFRSSSCRCS